MDKLLNLYKLPQDWDAISDMPLGNWKNAVENSTEQKNKEELLEMCTGKDGERTKSKLVISRLKLDDYIQKPLPSVMNETKSKARTQIMAMFGMLKCAYNFKYGHGGHMCGTCNMVDDENHRVKFKDTNLYLSPVKYDFSSVYANDEDAIGRTLEVI